MLRLLLGRAALHVAAGAALALSSPAAAQGPLKTPAAVASSNSIIVNLAQTEARRQLGRPVILDVRALNRQREWAFLYSTMVGSDRKPIDLAGTRFEGAAKAGVASRVFCALFRHLEGRWHVVATCLGVTDVAWTGWGEKYGAPKEVFDLANID